MRPCTLEKHEYLRYTILLLIIPILYFIFIRREKKILEYVLASFLVVIIITSQLFWINPIKNSSIHMIDSIVAKFVIVSFILYILVYKFKYIVLLFLLAVIICAYFSNYYSQKKWCSDQHLYWHGCLHIFCAFGAFYTFYLI